MKNNWVIGVVGSVIGFLVSQFMVFYTFTENLDTTKKIEMINLGKELVKDFYDKDNVLFKDVRMSIERCDYLYNGFNKNGKYDNDEINQYIGFFDDLGFYYKNGVLDLNVIKQYFGAIIIEAYEYAELKKYVEGMQSKAKQQTAFTEFQFLAQKLEALPEWQNFAEETRHKCQKGN